MKANNLSFYKDNFHSMLFW